MKYYFAPMEGITGYVFRNAYHRYFEDMDKYFTAFISPNGSRRMNSKEINDILPEHNEGMLLVPQILTNSSEAFIKTARELQEYGYHEVNLNLGCPSPTVVTKKKGSGFLAFPEELDLFLGEITDALGDMDISVKTRLGKDDPDEFYQLMEIYNKYPLKELIIHARVQADQYRNTPNHEMFGEAMRLCRHPLCYNGDIFTCEDFDSFTAKFPDTDTIMIGRGTLKNPGFLTELKTGKPTDKEALLGFHNYIFSEYQKVLFGDKTVLFKMKEIWAYLYPLFEDSEKHWKKIRKAQKLSDYEAAVQLLFAQRELRV